MTERTRRAVLLSMPHAALCVSGHVQRPDCTSLCFVSMPHAALCVSRHLSTRFTFATDGLFQCRTQHCVCRDDSSELEKVEVDIVSMPHAALCVSRQNPSDPHSCGIRVSMPHAALCVSRLLPPHGEAHGGSFNAARSIVCVETSLLLIRSIETNKFQCRTQHCVCRDGKM